MTILLQEKTYKPRFHTMNSLDFHLPAALEAGKPPEARGLRRDEVRLLVSYRSDDRIVHASFQDIASFLEPGDALIINTSATRPAAVAASRKDGTPLMLHVSTELPAGLWLVELRRPDGGTTTPFFEGREGEIILLPGGSSATLHKAYGGRRLWIASLALPTDLDNFLQAYGEPIRYRYVQEMWPIDYYQTVYATELGSAEMPSAGRPFTPELITKIVARGVHVAPLILHTGVASLEAHEAPYEEYYRVPAPTARVVNMVHAAGGRVIAVGTTVVRALETVTDGVGQVHPGEGWTNLVITSQRGVRAVNGLLTGLHEPEASHISMLEAIAGPGHIRHTYLEAVRERYLWHEFGDLHLILP